MLEKKYCTCEICLKMNSNNYCSYKEGTIVSPSKTWCLVGIVSIWMEIHEPKEVVEFLSILGRKS